MRRQENAAPPDRTARASDVVNAPREVVNTRPEVLIPLQRTVNTLPEVVITLMRTVNTALEVVDTLAEVVNTPPQVVNTPPEVVITLWGCNHHLFGTVDRDNCCDASGLSYYNAPPQSKYTQITEFPPCRVTPVNSKRGDENIEL